MSTAFAELWSEAAPLAPGRGARGEMWLVTVDWLRLLEDIKMPLVVTCSANLACDYRWAAVRRDHRIAAGIQCLRRGAPLASTVTIFDPSALPDDSAVVLAGNHSGGGDGVAAFTMRLWWWPYGAVDPNDKENSRG